jgi:hypothetical protein
MLSRRVYLAGLNNSGCSLVYLREIHHGCAAGVGNSYIGGSSSFLAIVWDIRILPGKQPSQF